jgi:hypothetical protein
MRRAGGPSGHQSDGYYPLLTALHSSTVHLSGQNTAFQTGVARVRLAWIRLTPSDYLQFRIS